MQRSAKSTGVRNLVRARSPLAAALLLTTATLGRPAHAEAVADPQEVLTSLESLTPAEPLILGPARSNRSIAAMMFDIGGGAPNKADIEKLLVTSARSLRAMYREISYGMQDIDVELLGPYELPEQTCLPIECCGPKSGQPNGPAVQDIIAGYAKKYDHYFWVYGDIPPNANCGTWGDEGSAAKPAVYSSYSFHGLVGYSQELGHNFGMTHEPYMTCPSNAIFPDDPSGCSHNEYGSQISFMGRGAGHPSAYHKVQQGWLSKCNGVKVGSTATITLMPLELPCDGVQVLQIKATKERSSPSSGDRQGQASKLTHYYVELRTPRGIDAGLNKLEPSVMIYAGPELASSSTRGAPYVYLLDQTPEGGNNPNLVNSGLKAGQSFVDPAGGVTIKVDSVSQDKAEVSVTLDGGAGGLTCLDGAAFTAPGPDVTSCGTLNGGGGGGGAAGAAGAAGTAGMAGAGGTAGASGGGNAGSAGSAGASGASGATSNSGTGGLGPSGAGGAPGAGTGGTLGGAPAAGGSGAGAHDDGGCGCVVAGGSRAASSWLLALALAAALARRRGSQS
jgi:hypothetical protein